MARPAAMPAWPFSVKIQFLLKSKNEILGPAGWGDHAVGQGFLQFGGSGSCFLRDREVFLQSRGAADRYRAGDPDQFPGLDIQHFFVLEIQKLLVHLHFTSPFPFGIIPSQAAHSQSMPG
jgi:hypothetical protein